MRELEKLFTSRDARARLDAAFGYTQPASPDAAPLAMTALAVQLGTIQEQLGKLNGSDPAKHATPKFTNAEGKTVRCCGNFCDGKRGGPGGLTCDGKHYDKDCPLGAPEPRLRRTANGKRPPKKPPETPAKPAGAVTLEQTGLPMPPGLASTTAPSTHTSYTSKVAAVTRVTAAPPPSASDFAASQFLGEPTFTANAITRQRVAAPAHT